MSFTESIFHEGVISTLLGLPGAGKTNVAVFFMENAVKHGFYIYTNIHFFDYETIPEALKLGKLPKLLKGQRYNRKPEHIQTITTISGLLLGCLKTPKNVTIIDEGGFFATSSAATSKKVRQLKELAYIIRHLNSSMMIIAQSKGSIVPDLRKTLLKYQLDVEKVSPKWRELSIKTSVPVMQDGERVLEMKEIDRIGGIPMATIPWDGYFLPKFKFDIDLTEAFDELGEYNSVDVLKVGPDIIKKLKESNESSDNGTIKEQTREKMYDEARDLYLIMENSGEFKNKTSLLSQLAAKYKKTTQWSYNICRDLPFDKSKFNTQKKKRTRER